MHVVHQVFSLTSPRVYKEFGSTNMKYKNRIRSRYSNLKDTKNPKLRQMVLTGDIKPEKIAVMTAEVRGRTAGMDGDFSSKYFQLCE